MQVVTTSPVELNASSTSARELATVPTVNFITASAALTSTASSWTLTAERYKGPPRGAEHASCDDLSLVGGVLEPRSGEPAGHRAERARESRRGDAAGPAADRGRGHR